MLTLQHKKLRDSSPTEFVNVYSNRINKLDKSGFEYLIITKKDKSYYICGEKSEVEEFLKENEIKKKYVQKYEPDIDHNDDHLCQLGVAGSVLHTPISDDVADVPLEIMSSMCPFELLGLSGKARVTEIQDGDTLNVLFNVRISELTRTRLKNRKTEARTPVLTRQLDASFMAIFCLRLNGIDMAEHDTAAGQFATLLLKDYIARHNNIVYIRIIKYEKYGRLLCSIYIDPEMTQLINGKLLNVNVSELSKIVKKGIKKGVVKPSKGNKSFKHDDDELGVLCLKYNGETKSDIMKMMPLVPSNFINSEDHLDLLMKYRIV